MRIKSLYANVNSASERSLIVPDSFIKALFVFTGFLLIHRLTALLPHAHPAGRYFLHAVMGLSGLLILNTIGGLFGLNLGLNAVTLPIAAGLGLPGVGALWILRYLL